MLEQLIYKNHVNEVFEFGKLGIYVNSNDLHSYEWAVTKKNNRIASIGREISKRSLPVVIICETEAEGIAARNSLMEITDKDCLANQPGQVIIGNYYFKCFVTASKKTEYLTDKRYMAATLTLTSDRPYWVKETTQNFNSIEFGTSAPFLDYPYDYSYDYTSAMAIMEINNASFVSSDFRLIIYGACSNPTISIGNHTYQVNCSVGAGEYLTIDSTNKKIFLTSSTGIETNKFSARNKQSYIFEKIPTGNSVIAWDGELAFDITILEERSEPKWT